MTPEEVIILTALLGEKEVVAGAEAEGAAIAGLGEETRVASARTKEYNAQQFLMRQGLFTARRLIYGTTLALLAGTAALVHMGFTYNSTMQQATVALTPVFHSTQALHNELLDLFKIAAETPFQFPDITNAFRVMFAGLHPLGIQAGEINQIIQALADNLAYAGKSSPANLNRVSFALQHMAYQGRVTGQILYQLGRDGIPVYAILAKELHLTADQIHNIGRLGIPAGTFLEAFIKYTQTTAGPRGAAWRLQLMTFSGAWSTFKDALGQAMGGGTGQMFNFLTNALGRVDRAMEPFFDNRRPVTLIGLIKALNEGLTPGTNIVLNLFYLLYGIIKGVGILFWVLYQAVRAVGAIFGPFHVLQSLITDVFKYMGDYLGILIGLFLLYKGGVIAATIATDIWDASIFLINVSMGIFTVLVGAAAFAVDGLAASLLALSVALGIPAAIILVVLAVVALVAILVVLYFKWKAFHDLVNNTATWLWQHWPYVAVVLATVLGPIALMIAVVGTAIKYWKQLLDIINAVVDGLKWVANLMHKIGSFFGHVFGGGGGNIQAQQFNFNGRSQPQPNFLGRPAGFGTAALAPVGGGHGGFTFNIQPQHIYLDGKKIAEVTATKVTDKQARL
jgi:hypothetical protein